MDTRRFRITYHKMNSTTDQNAVINVSKPTGDIGKDAHAALNLFVSAVGNLKRFDVTEIQEISDKNKPIGEPIRPTGDASVVPVKK